MSSGWLTASRRCAIEPGRRRPFARPLSSLCRAFVEPLPGLYRAFAWVSAELLPAFCRTFAATPPHTRL